MIQEGFANPCQVAGVEIGVLAYSMGVFAAWGLLMVLPFSLGSGLLWAIVALVAHLIRRRG
ncbi:hypothetical protein [Aliiruegeria lutimaris]|uniref:hypothetical protein n=1 Tax=Aliiruegeria lutimaris TaxID=571298 RepID=UPI001FCE1BA7|nr:hypothetical protein [Aliiruegeria lutimaris]